MVKLKCAFGLLRDEKNHGELIENLYNPIKSVMLYENSVDNKKSFTIKLSEKKMKMSK